ncbi:MAG: VacB/RNase II family 3'-5' exoribonuclease, partial [Clostridia bacterium]|nr:VacB/RNase II family 3'-5' exoribonuclease [Clostridia bacterium]
RVIPMLPEKLSNGICSLNEGVDRLTLSIIMDINRAGDVINYEICEGVIRSKKRMTYSNVQKMLDGDEEALKKFSEFKELIFNANELKEILSNKRLKRGNIDLDVEESHITVENGKIHVGKRASKEAYKIIEEFMIVANETTAEYVYYMDLPFVYRIHEKPTAEKLLGFIGFLNALGIVVKWNEETCHPKDFQTVLEKLKDNPVYSVVNKVMLRSMQKAKYSPNNVGHFGLSSKCYCHFTSPIRRYPDLVVHSIIKGILKGKDVENLYSDFVTVASNISSLNERKADEVERDMDDYYKCRYMRSYIGEEFSGIVSGVTNFGIFVELENTVEGIIRLETLPKDKYTLNEKTFTLEGHKWQFSLGDKLDIKVISADTTSRRVEFIITGYYR